MVGKNLFVDLAEKIAKELGISDCWVCGGALMSEKWPWRGTGLDPFQIMKWNHSVISKERERPSGWILTSRVMGEECLGRVGGQFVQFVGETLCKRVYT